MTIVGKRSRFLTVLSLYYSRLGWVRCRCVEYRVALRDGMWRAFQTRTGFLFIDNTSVSHPEMLYRYLSPRME